MATTQISAPVKIKDYEPLNLSTVRGRFALGLGSLLIVLTGFFWYVAWGHLPSSIQRPNVPPDVFAAITFCFFGAPGLFLAFVGATDLRNESRIRRERKLYPTEPWWWDHPWTWGETTDIGLRQSAKGLVALLMAVGVVVPLNYLFISEADPPFAILGIVVLGFFDLVLLLALGTVIYRIAAQILHGRAKLRFDQFPLRLGECAELTLLPHAAIEDVDHLTFVLRCIEEQSEAHRTHRASSDTGRTTTVTKLGLQRYYDQQTIPGHELTGVDGVTVSFNLPEDNSLRTQLSEIPSLHWELTVQGKRPGMDLCKRFLLPIY